MRVSCLPKMNGMDKNPFAESNIPTGEVLEKGKSDGKRGRVGSGFSMFPARNYVRINSEMDFIARKKEKGRTIQNAVERVQV
jgi:hypothetical protein